MSIGGGSNWFDNSNGSSVLTGLELLKLGQAVRTE
jgi:hypothetical protein